MLAHAGHQDVLARGLGLTRGVLLGAGACGRAVVVDRNLGGVLGECCNDPCELYDGLGREQHALTQLLYGRK